MQPVKLDSGGGGRVSREGRGTTMRGGRPWPRRPLWDGCFLRCPSQGQRRNRGPTHAQRCFPVGNTHFVPIFHSLFFTAEHSPSRLAAGLRSPLPQEAGGALLSTGTPMPASPRPGSFLDKNRCPPRILWHCSPNRPCQARGKGKRGAMCGHRPTLRGRAGQDRPHRPTCGSPDTIFLTFHHVQQPILPLVLFFSPPPQRVRLKGVIKLVTPNAVRASRAHSHKW